MGEASSGDLNPSSEANTVRLRDLGMSFGRRLLSEQPTLVFTFAYIGLTLVGLVYDAWFYFYFKVNILEYSEASDFLFAAIRNPLVIILSLLPIALIFGLMGVRRKAMEKSARYQAYAKRYDASRWNTPAMKAFIYGWFIVVYAILFTQIYAQRVANNIKAGDGRYVVLHSSGGATSLEKPILLGTTNRFFFLYYRSRRETEIVPVGSVASVTVDSRRKKERKADSLAALKRVPVRR